MRTLIVIVAGVLFGCASTGAEKKIPPEKKMSQPMIVAMSLCRDDHRQSVTPDPQGKRIVCEREEVVGSHFERCVCREEEQSEQDRNEAQEYMRRAVQSPQTLHGG